MGLQFAGRWFGRCPASTLESICLAVDTNGCPVYIDWCERHLLTIGESDSGKGSVLANLLVQVEPFAQAGLVRLYGIDLKAMELSMSRAMFQTVAIDVVVPEFLRTLVFARPRGDDQFADCTFSPSLDMSR